MTASRVLAVLSFIGLAARALGGEPTVARGLCEEFDRVESVACEIAKTTTRGANTLRMVSRVFFRRPDRIHVENVSPVARRVIADGRSLYYHEARLPSGYSRPIADLDDDWKLSLRTVPGTAMRHLLKLKNLPEVDLPGTAAFPVRKGYQAGTVFAVLCLDATNRLAQIEFFDNREMKKKTAVYEYGEFERVADTWWFPCRHEGTLFAPGEKDTREITRIRNLQVNVPIPDRRFLPDEFFKGVEFVPDFEAMYK